MNDVKIENMEQAKEVMNTLKEKLKNAKSAIEKKDIRLAIVDVKQKMLSLEKKQLANEKKIMEQKVKKLNSAMARKCRNHGLICIALGVLYQQHKINEFEKICFGGNSAVEEFAKINFGYAKGETK